MATGSLKFSSALGPFGGEWVPRMAMAARLSAVDGSAAAYIKCGLFNVQCVKKRFPSLCSSQTRAERLPEAHHAQLS